MDTTKFYLKKYFFALYINNIIGFDPFKLRKCQYFQLSTFAEKPYKISMRNLSTSEIKVNPLCRLVEFVRIFPQINKISALLKQEINLFCNVINAFCFPGK